MPTIEINDTTIHYEQSGQGPAVLFIHGMCGDADVWADQAARFSDRYTCVRYDRRGHTRSAWGDAKVTDALHADDAAALIEALDLAPCLVVSSSAGAAIAADVALRYGHLLRGAVLSEPPLFCADRDAGAALMRDLVPPVEAAIAKEGLRAGVDAFFNTVCPGLWSVIDESRKDRYRDNAEIGFADIDSPSLDVNLAELSTITVPALIVSGDNSHPTFGAIAQALAAALPDVRLVELENCGHVTYAEQPEAFAHAVAVFAGEIERRSHEQV